MRVRGFIAAATAVATASVFTPAHAYDPACRASSVATVGWPGSWYLTAAPPDQYADGSYSGCGIDQWSGRWSLEVDDTRFIDPGADVYCSSTGLVGLLVDLECRNL